MVTLCQRRIYECYYFFKCQPKLLMLMHLGLLTKSCDYGGFEEETIRNHIVMSCNSSRLHQKDLSVGNRSLCAYCGKRIYLSWTSPNNCTDNGIINGKGEYNSINAIRRLEITLNDRNREIKWLRCRKSGYLGNNKFFKERSITCNLCQKVGHFVSECWCKSKINSVDKNHTHVKKVGHTSEFLFGIYWWTWKTNNY